MSEIKDTREETKSKRWLAIYGAYIAVQVQERIRLSGDAYIDIQRMKGFMEEAETIADLEIEVGMEIADLEGHGFKSRRGAHCE